MPYLAITDFKNGLDRRRPKANGIPGSLWRAENCVISRGGDVEKAKAFTSVFTLPAGTHSLARVAGTLQVFSDSSATMPLGVSLQVLAAPGSPTMERVLDVKTPDGKAYVIAQYDDGNIHHFYDGARVSDWDALADANASFASVASFLAEAMTADSAVRVSAIGSTIRVQARTAGTAFTLSATATDGGGTNDQTMTVTTVTANVAAVANVDATATVTITGGSASLYGTNRVDQITADGNDLLSTAVEWITSNNATAAAVAAEINNGTSTHGYSASAASAVVTISAPAVTGATHNGDAVTVTTNGDVTASKTDFSGGVDAVTAVAQEAKIEFGGTFEAQDLFAATLNGTVYRCTGRASAMGTYALVHKSRIYVVAYDLLRYSQINDYDDFTDANASSGAGLIAISGSEGASRLVALAKYQDRVAVFARDFVQTWYLETDAQNNQVGETLEDNGTIAPWSLAPYGNSDVFYLDETGIRSLQARDSSNAAFVSDVGTVIDTFVAEIRDGLTARQVRDARATIEPRDGRYMLAIDETIIVLSRFPGERIAAWTTLDQGIAVEAFARIDGDLYARAGDTIYVYGGQERDQYVESGDCVVELPFLDIKTPGTHKHITGFDFSCVGTWKVEILTDPADDTVVQEVARVRECTFNLGKIAGGIRAAHFGVRFTCLSEGAASLSQVLIHHDKKDAG